MKHGSQPRIKSHSSLGFVHGFVHESGSDGQDGRSSKCVATTDQGLNIMKHFFGLLQDSLVAKACLHWFKSTLITVSNCPRFPHDINVGIRPSPIIADIVLVIVTDYIYIYIYICSLYPQCLSCHPRNIHIIYYVWLNIAH